MSSLRRLDDKFERWIERRVMPTAVGRFLAARQSRAGEHTSLGKFAVLVVLLLLVAGSLVRDDDARGGFVFLLVAAAFAVVALLLRSRNRL